MVRHFTPKNCRPVFFKQIFIAEPYRIMTELFIVGLEETEQYCWLLQDGATAHTTTEMMDFLKTFIR